MNWLRLLQSAPDAIRLTDAVTRAIKGDAQAIDYLKNEGWYQGLDVLQPGMGSIAQQVKHHLDSTASAIRDTLSGNVIEGEFREVVPWEHFASWLRRQKWGTFVILGPKGQGKSTLALRLAQVWQQERRWPVLAVNAYPEERYPFVEPVSTQKFMNEIKSIMRLLNPPPPKEGEDERPDLGPEELDRRLTPYKRRIIVIDEMSLAVGTSGMDAGRLMVRQIMAQARHLNWLIIYIGQLTKMLPQDLLNCEVVFIKKPAGREALTDRQEPLTQDLWERAIEAFGAVRREPQWEYYPDVRAWAYVDCQDMGNGQGYQGMIPFSKPSGDEIDGEFREVIQ